MSEAFEKLEVLASAVHPLPAELMQQFLSIWQPFEAGRKELITVAGETEKYLYFVYKGVQRVYYMGEDGREATLVFTYATSFGGVMDALLLQKPSRYFYETLTPSSFLRASYEELHVLMQSAHEIESLIRKGVTAAASGLLERLVELQCFTAEERFRTLLQRSPHMLQLVAHKYLANYLGMDATNFSKLLNNTRL